MPLTTQWDTKGYYYPTQVCQYALAHWSKHVMDLNDKKSANTETLYEDGAAHQVPMLSNLFFSAIDNGLKWYWVLLQRFFQASLIFVSMASGLPSQILFYITSRFSISANKLVNNNRYSLFSLQIGLWYLEYWHYGARYDLRVSNKCTPCTLIKMENERKSEQWKSTFLCNTKILLYRGALVRQT